jgi:hypothetical protein
MDPNSETLIRHVLHDMANTLAGVRGILELNPEGRPLTTRDRDRLEAVIAEGMVTLARGRHLAMGTLPAPLPEGGDPWRRSLHDLVQPLSVLYRCRLDFTYQGDPAWDHWPGELLKGYVHALTRDLLPYAQDGVLGIRGSADAREWRLLWSPTSAPAEILHPGKEPRDTNSRWIAQAGSALGVRLEWDGGAILAHIPRT